jgi:hypothetical protein
LGDAGTPPGQRRSVSSKKVCQSLVWNFFKKNRRPPGGNQKTLLKPTIPIGVEFDTREIRSLRGLLAEAIQSHTENTRLARSSNGIIFFVLSSCLRAFVVKFLTQAVSAKTPLFTKQQSELAILRGHVR